jgi:Na+-driven multidrug efflux pump
MNAEEILLLLQQEPEIAHLAGVFLQWFSLGLPAYAFNAIVRQVEVLIARSKTNSDKQTVFSVARFVSANFLSYY